MNKIKVFLLVAVLLLSGCANFTHEKIVTKQNELNKLSVTTISKMIASHPELESKLVDSVAYAVVDMDVLKGPFLGVGWGEGSLVVQERIQPIYLKVRRVDIGAGWGVRSYKLLILLNNDRALQNWIDGGWKFDVGAEAAAGKLAGDGSSNQLSSDLSTYMLTDEGASVSVTARLVKVRINNKLTTL